MKVTRIHDRVHRITTPFGDGGVVFLYLIKGEQLALVDTGGAFSPAQVLRPALASIGLALSDIELILNTHSHHDHAGGNVEVKKASGAPIHVHSGDLFMANSTEAQVEYQIAPLRALDLPAELVEHHGQYTAREAGLPAGADVILAEGDTVDLGAGVRLRVVHTPGHTPGCITYWWEAEGIALVGDGVQGQGSRAGGHPQYRQAADYRRSTVKLLELEPRLLCLSHAFLGGTAINDPTREGEDGKAFLRTAIQTTDTIHSVVVEAVKRLPGATKGEVARAAAAELIYHIPTLLVRQTGLTRSSAPCLLAHTDAALEGSYPG